MRPLSRSIKVASLFLLLSSALSAVEPAAWVKQWEKYAAPPARNFIMVRLAPEPNLSKMLADLPEPARWGEVEAALAEAEAGATAALVRKRLRLGRWLVMEMNGRGEAVAAEVEAARVAEEIDEDTARYLAEGLGRSETATPEMRVKAFEAEVAEQAGRKHTFGGEHDYVPGITTPDLVTLVGEARAEELLRAALVVRATLQIEHAAEPTRRLALKLATELASKLGAAQWDLARDVEAVELYEALRRRFGTPKQEDYRHDQARAYYIVGLILADRADDALAEAEKAGDRFDMPYGLADRLGRGGHEAAVHAFLHRLLARRPDAGKDLWSSYRRFSIQLGEQEGMLALIRAQAADTGLGAVARLRASERLAMAELATDDIAAGVARLRATLAEVRALEGQEVFANELAHDLLRVGRALEDASLTAEAVAAVRDFAIAGLKTERESYEHSMSVNAALEALADAGAKAELLEVAAAFEAKVAELRATANKDGHRYIPRNILAEVGEARLRLAVEEARWEDAGNLLATGEGWGAADVAGVIRERYVGKNETPFGVLVAKVLRARGDEAGARRALEAQIVKTAGSDATFAEYIDLLGAEATPLLDALYSLDQYEERPLIWKAVLASRAGDQVGAERLARAAVAVDPSDGEQGRGDRMRVYAVLGEARAAQGDAKEAEFFARVVKAIRLSEEADKWHAAGLFTRSVEGYRKALGLFADAYCVQSRLAIRLTEEGRMEEAMEHYRKAYELMPDSFGRVESHCFGCESAFAGERQQGVAEKVFQRMAESDPRKPQVPYLLGYLREEQQRLGEAAELYTRAVELDPLYLNAWKKLGGLAERMAMPVAQRDEIALRLISLDPLGRHSSPNLARVADGAALWAALAEAKAKAAVLPNHASVLPLPASAAALRAEQSSGYSPSVEKDRRAPEVVFAERNFARQVERAVSMSRYAR